MGRKKSGRRFAEPQPPHTCSSNTHIDAAPDKTDAPQFVSNIGRRKFVKNVGLAGLALAVAGPPLNLLVGCSSDNTESNASGLASYMLTGQILDANTQKGIDGATVSLPAHKVSTKTKSDGTFSLDVPATGPTEITVAAAGYLGSKALNVVETSPVGTVSASSGFFLGLVPVTPSFQAIPHIAATITAPQNPSSKDLPSPAVSLPDGTLASNLQVSVSSSFAVNQGAWIAPNVDKLQLPTSPRVYIRLTGDVSAANIPDNATVSIPSYLPFPTGTQVDIAVGSTDSNEGSATVPGIMQANGTVQAGLKNILTALTAVGLGPAGQTGPTDIVLQLAKTEIPADNVTTTSDATTISNPVTAKGSEVPNVLFHTKPSDSTTDVSEAKLDEQAFVPSTALNDAIVNGLGVPPALTTPLSQGSQALSALSLTGAISANCQIIWETITRTITIRIRIRIRVFGRWIIINRDITVQVTVRVIKEIICTGSTGGGGGTP
ncbi:carboxypeptidase-like regulatory domain-containing protein [Geotalea uraniireducens]|uniref:Carboxypeptidase regulatory-like domain-containing protein n=1 Tax=Geotalea uraniireducens (strain Rf4) TaxID=351605 RepID=A5GEK7_GEOUR|nr:carboxypeptidase-like regulatory domain-containing protein [Geotalea uraniireducens]ABQ25862.1 hypothetical protein Gura_1667 [Geotalea uraniireducens Rf4]